MCTAHFGIYVKCISFTLNSKAVGYAIKHFPIFYDTSIVSGIICSCRVNFKLTPSIQRCLVNPGCLFSLEKPPSLRWWCSWVAATKMNLWPPTLKDFSSDRCNLSGVSHWWCFANNLGTSSFSLLCRSCHQKLILFSVGWLWTSQSLRIVGAWCGFSLSHNLLPCYLPCLCCTDCSW